MVARSFHISGSTGQVGPCRAAVRCPFGGETGQENHFASREEAQAEVSQRLENEFKGFLKGESKSESTEPRLRVSKTPVSENNATLKDSKSASKPVRFEPSEIVFDKEDWKTDSLIKDAQFALHSGRNDASFELRQGAPLKLTGPYHKRLVDYANHMEQSVSLAANINRINDDEKLELQKSIKDFKKTAMDASRSPLLSSEEKVRKINRESIALNAKIKNAVAANLTKEQKEKELRDASAVVHTNETIKSMIRYYDVEGRPGISAPENGGMESFQRATYKPVLDKGKATIDAHATATPTGEIRPVQTEFGIVQTYPNVKDPETGKKYFEFRVNNQWFRSDNYGDAYEINVPERVDPITGHLRSEGVLGGIKDYFRRKKVTG